MEARGESRREIALGLGSPAAERRGDELARIADALERIATVAEGSAPKPRRREIQEVEVTDADRAAARAIARRMGLHVPENKR